MGSDRVPGPGEARLGDARTARVVDPDEAESLRESVPPFEVVEQRPDDVAANVDTGGDRIEDGAEMTLEVGDALRVAHLAVGGDIVVERHAILQDVERRGRVVVADPEQKLSERRRVAP